MGSGSAYSDGRRPEPLFDVDRDIILGSENVVKSGLIAVGAMMDNLWFENSSYSWTT